MVVAGVAVAEVAIESAAVVTIKEAAAAAAAALLPHGLSFQVWQKY
jgi:hypothetical protein